MWKSRGANMYRSEKWKTPPESKQTQLFSHVKNSKNKIFLTIFLIFPTNHEKLRHIIMMKRYVLQNVYHRNLVNYSLKFNICCFLNSCGNIKSFYLPKIQPRKSEILVKPIRGIFLTLKAFNTEIISQKYGKIFLEVQHLFFNRFTNFDF